MIRSVYAYVPKMIEYYLGEQIIIPNVPDLYLRRRKGPPVCARQYWTAGGEGGQRVGRIRHARRAALERREQREIFKSKIEQTPRNYIAQPTWRFRACRSSPMVGFDGRHVDLRPYILYGKDIYVLPGGLTRVALREGSLVVNSSQGGGSKDTWVLSRS